MVGVRGLAERHVEKVRRGTRLELVHRYILIVGIRSSRGRREAWQSELV